MRARPVVRIAVLLTLVSGVALAYNGGAPASKTGAPAIGGKPAEAACNCHNDFALNTGGTVELINAPAYYQPGTAYTMKVRITSGQTAGDTGRLWGFELTAVRVSDGTGAGTFADVAGEGTTIVSGSGNFSTRRYSQVATKDFAGVASPVEWQVRWTAPNPGVGPIRFFFSGLAGNGDTGSTGDWVYTGSFSTDDITPVMSASWGDVKSRYRR